MTEQQHFQLIDNIRFSGKTYENLIASIVESNAAPNLSCRFFTASHETLIWARKDTQMRSPVKRNAA